MSTWQKGQLLAGAVVGVALAALVGIFGLGIGLMWDKTTGVFLEPVSGVCTITSKEPKVVAKRSQTVVWTIQNACDTAQTVTVGNFRTVGSSGPNDCSASTAGGATYPFNKEPLSDRQDTTQAWNGNGSYPSGKIKLKVKGDLAGGETYDFDLCVGANGGTKVDPQLIIER